AALRALKASGRKLILVTGRELDDLQRVYPENGVFDRIVAENGALLHEPAARKTRLLGAEADPRLVERLRRREVPQLMVGRSIVATIEPYETVVLESIRELGLELQLIFNKGSVMVLPPGVNKESGLCAALAELELALEKVAAVGDAENDHALLSHCGFAV